MTTNQFNQPVGFPIKNWTPCDYPPHVVLAGRFGRLDPLNRDHTDALYAAYMTDRNDTNWTYLPYGPFDSADAFAQFIADISSGLYANTLFYAVIDGATDAAVGIISYLRINPPVGSIEAGHIHYAPPLQRQPLATEAMYLLMRHAFDDLGYRRYEWKCDALNAPSRNAALRLGFSFEGVFRQATMYKGRNRDTAWFSILDSEWPALKAAFEAWLHPDNFDADGRQHRSLRSFRE